MTKVKIFNIAEVSFEDTQTEVNKFLEDKFLIRIINATPTYILVGYDDEALMEEKQGVAIEPNKPKLEDITKDIEENK